MHKKIILLEPEGNNEKNLEISDIKYGLSLRI